MRRAALTSLAAIVIALVAAFDFARAASDCTTDPCVYVPLIRAGSGPAGGPIPTLFGPPPSPIATNAPTPIAAPTRTPTSSPTPTRDPAVCAAEYPTICIPPPPPDLDCSEIPYTNFTVLPPDRHRFDGNGDGIGCEK